MGNSDLVRRVFVEKKTGFGVYAEEIKKDLVQNLKISEIEKVRVLNRYDLSGVTDKEYEKAVKNVFAEAVSDNVYMEEADLKDASFVFAVESLPGQYNQRADSASQCIQILTCGEKPECHVAEVIAIYGKIKEEDREKISDYIINPVESRKASLDKPKTLKRETTPPGKVKTIEGFTDMDTEGLMNLSDSMGLAMSQDDLIFIQNYFRSENRNPTVTELRVLDTYWSDHCRHTTFLTRVGKVDFDNDKMTEKIKQAYEDYLGERKKVYGKNIDKKPVCLMDIATIAMKSLKKSGGLSDLDESEEINACSIKVPVTIDGTEHDYLVMFKNETHNHPTEIEPFGGAATCLGGAIRDPLSGRSYVYQAMRVTGSADPTVPLDKTLPGKLSQRKITTKAAAGYSSYGNQIGLATGQVEELYHPGYVAKRMEIGAVIAAAPARNVVREKPCPGDLVILLGGRTGRDGCGGATGSSKEHDEKSILTCGSEVQKGNPPTERKIQRLFRKNKVSTLIKRCNDFGAGGVCVAIGELADGITINLDKVLKKYDGLDGTELAISESQERMAVVISPENEEKFLEYAAKENLEAVTVATITKKPEMVMMWQNEKILELKREFIDTNGAPQNTDVFVNKINEEDNYFRKMPEGFCEDDFRLSVKNMLSSLSSCSRKGLVERFDSTVGAGTVLMPFGGITQTSPENGMAAKIPVDSGESDTATVMTFGFDPFISSWSPFHGAYYAVLESLYKIAAMGANPLKARLTFQEYFERLGDDPEKWGKPFSALLGAYKAQTDYNTPAIGGKDSMSGTFRDLSVPPTLVSFAVGTTKPGKVISACFSGREKTVLFFPVIRDGHSIPVKKSVLTQFDAINKWHENNNILSASTVRENGTATAVIKMCLGNGKGFDFSGDMSLRDLFSPNTASLIAGIDKSIHDLENDEIYTSLKKDGLVLVLGTVNDTGNISFKTDSIPVSECRKIWEKPLENVFPAKAEPSESAVIDIDEKSCGYKRIAPRMSAAKPRVFMPVFPGTNCEYDTQRAFEKAGGIVETVVFRNLTGKDIENSVSEMRRAIENSNIIMIPGGFSGGDEPDGSGKFIAAAFKNPYIEEEIHRLLYERDGLMLGICNGFQALIKLGLLPYGKIKQIEENDPTLTYNNIGRHVSCYVKTKVVSNRSPWLAKTTPGDVHLVPVSHGEGKFIASPHMIKALSENGQIATLYVDNENMPSTETPYNPNGSLSAVEGITALDGRIFGKMGHSERKGNNIAVNIPGNKNQGIFESGIEYYK